MAQDLRNFKDRNPAERIGRDGLVKELALKFPNRTKVELRETLDCLLDTLTEALLSGKRIELRGFCTMWPVRRGTRRAYSPIGKRVYKLDAHWTVRFTVGKTVKRALMEHLEE